MTASARTAEDMRGILGIARKLGLRTFEVPGWESRGLGELNPKKLLGHHTAAEVDVDRLLRDGRSDLRGPLCNFALHRDGAFGAVAAGRANHAGPGIVPSSASYGTETTGPIPIAGTGPVAFPQYRAFVLSQAAICIWHGWQASNWLGHRESARPLGRKIDPAFDCGRFRADMAEVIADWEDQPWRPTFPISSGQHNHGVLVVQKHLNRHGARLDEDGRFGPRTEQAVKDFQRTHALPVTGTVEQPTWEALGRAAI
jgi:peptidoglycan hydrolase-like protein with peptidoglycan-binding domain